MAVLFIMGNLRILLQIVTNDPNNISDVVFRQTGCHIRDGPIDIRGGGGWDFFEKIVCFPTEAKKIKCLQRS